MSLKREAGRTLEGTSYRCLHIPTPFLAILGSDSVCLSIVCPIPCAPHSRPRVHMQMDTSNILFICGGAFAGLERVVGNRLSTSSIGFGANMRKDVGDMVRRVDCLLYELSVRFIVA